MEVRLYYKWKRRSFYAMSSFIHLTCFQVEDCITFIHFIFYKNAENLAEPRIFLTSASYFSNCLPLAPSKTT